MNKHIYLFKLLLTLQCFIWTADSFAIGLGLSAGAGTQNWSDDYDQHNGGRDLSNYGVFFDTAIAKDRIFNYRVTILREENKADAAGLNMEGIAITNDFVFGVYANDVVKLWVGPQLKVMSYNDLTLSDTPNRKISGDVTGYGFAPVIGVNVHLAKIVSFSASAAYYMFGTMTGSYEYLDENDSFYNYTDVDANFSGFSISLSVIFRIRDEYKKLNTTN